MNAFDPNCPFCAIAAGAAWAAVVDECAHTLSFLDLRQFHPGHVLVVPKQHYQDLRELDGPGLGALRTALMTALSRVSRAVSLSMENEGISVWHSIGPAAHQEVPHLHFHIHPRRHGDRLLAVYPSAPPQPERGVLEGWAAALRAQL